MLGSLVIGAEGVHQQEVDRVTGVASLGPLVITPEDRERALVDAGLVPQVAPSAAPASAGLGAPDKGLTVREVQQALRDNPASVRQLLAAEASRAAQGLEVRASVLKAGRAVAVARGEADLVEKVDALLAQLTPEE